VLQIEEGTMRSTARLCAVALLAAAPAASCTWVPLTESGGRVLVADATRIDRCEKLGSTRSKTSDRVVFFQRTERKVSEELATLARNEAAQMGGDTVVPLGEPEDGRQAFDVYRCGPGA
jgi:hypothetical protein